MMRIKGMRIFVLSWLCLTSAFAQQAAPTSTSTPTATPAIFSPQTVADLKRLYSRFDPNKETVVYCQSGVRASETAGVLQELGFTKVKIYDSSWLGYGNTLDAPAANVTFFNVGLLNSRLTALQNRLDELEKELAEAKAKK